MKQHKVKIGRHDLVMTDPGVEWVLEQQEEAQTPNGFSARTYAKAILRDCVAPKLAVGDFDHESEVVQLVREFTSFRRPRPAQTKEAREEGGGSS